MTSTNHRVRRNALMTRWFKPLRCIVVAMAIVTFGFAGAAVTSSTAWATPTSFHLHANAYSTYDNCADWDWTTSGTGKCVAQTQLPGFRPFFSSKVVIRWCTASTNCTDVGNKALTLPAGDSRWMLICSVGPGTVVGGNVPCDRGNWLVGAVRGVNGPFTVMEGQHDERPVGRSGTGAVESPGGPLFLYIGWWGRVGLPNGGHANGYVFGLRGHLDIAPQ
jgi:hypothetical protein